MKLMITVIIALSFYYIYINMTGIKRLSTTKPEKQKPVVDKENDENKK